eukprot:2215298-Amphidinium_carterae.1
MSVPCTVIPHHVVPFVLPKSSAVATVIVAMSQQPHTHFDAMQCTRQRYQLETSTLKICAGSRPLRARSLKTLQC